MFYKEIKFQRSGYIYFSSKKYRWYCYRGSAEKDISKNLNSLSIAVPDSGELAKFDNLIQPIFKQIRTLDRENGRLSKIKQELLKNF